MIMKGVSRTLILRVEVLGGFAQRSEPVSDLFHGENGLLLQSWLFEGNYNDPPLTCIENVIYNQHAKKTLRPEVAHDRV